MRRGLLMLASVIFLLLWAATVTLWAVSYWIKPKPGDVSRFTPDGYRIKGEVRALAYKGEISFYNYELPYTGSIIAVSSRAGPQPKWPQVMGFDFLWIYFRYIKWPGQFAGGVWWTLTIPFIWPFALSAVLPTAYVIAYHRRRWRIAAGLCPNCCYNLTGNVSGTCPECGSAVARRTEIAA